MCGNTGYKSLYGNCVRKWKKFRQILLPLLLAGALLPSDAWGQQTGICDRTQQVQDAIVAAVSGKTTCGAITTTDLAGITSLSVTNDSSLTALKTGDFDGLTGLTTLYLTNNGLTSLPAGVFDELSSLTELNLSGNDLSSLPAGVFDKLTSLTKLQLNVNGLSSLPAGVFDELTSLTLLGLNRNLLSSLPADVFDKLTSLQVLALASNKLTTLPAGVFDKLTGLTLLRLDNNKGLTTLPAGVFDKLTSLTTLQLNHNALTTLPAGVFDKLTSLTTLFFSNRGPNALRSLPAGVFDKLTSLKTLSLLGNRLSSLPAGVFDELTSLEVLVLQNNGLSTLPPRVFDKLTSLRGLLLDGNPNLGCLPSIPLSLPRLYNLDKPASAYAACGAAVTVTPTSLTVDENATSTYTVVLDEAPNRFANSGNVTVTPASSDTTKATVSGPLTFTIWDWSTPQTVTVTGVATGPATISHTISGGGYGSATASDVGAVVGRVLVVSSITPTTAKLTLGGWTQAWSYKGDYVNCVNVNAGTSEVDLSGLRSGWDFLIFAYNAANCPITGDPHPVLASATFSTPLPKVSGVTTAAGNASLSVSWNAQGGANGYHVQWKSGTEDWSSGRQSDVTTNSATISSLVNGTRYTIRVRSYKNIHLRTRYGVWSDEATGTPVGPMLTASNVLSTSATLTLANHTGNWYYKHTTPTGGQCSTAQTGTTASLTNLSPNTSYTYKAYSDSGCTTANLLATASAFLTKPGKPTRRETVPGTPSAPLDLTPSFGAATIEPQSYTQHSPIEPMTLPMASGGDGNLIYTLTPALPAGLTFDAVTCTLSGMPTEASAMTTYTYTATDADGDDATLTLSLTVVEPASFGEQRVANLRLPRGLVMEPLVLPEARGGNGPLTYALNPAPPVGLTFDPNTRMLSGVPTRVYGPQSYEYTATDAGVGEPDVARLTFTIEVVVSAAERARVKTGLAAQGRALLSGATSVIGERFRSHRAPSVPGVVAACTGRTPAPAKPGAESPPEDCATGVLTAVTESLLGLRGGSAGLTDEDVTRPRGPRGADLGAQPAWNWESLVWGRSFAVPLTNAGTGGSAWTLWGAGDLQGFQGDPGSGQYDGQVRSLYLGVDMQWKEQWLVGAALARSWGETDYVAGTGGSAGQLETTLTSIYPYVRGTLETGLEVWAMGSYGRGEAEATDEAAPRDLSLAMGATGARQPMTDWGGLQLAVVGAAGYLTLATDGGESVVADLDVVVQRARLAVEATGTYVGLAPYLQVGGRYDGGVGQTGAGLETVVGVRYTGERLEFEARGRWLAAHAAEGYEEYGGLARLAVKPLADGTGFRLNVAPRWGAADGAGLLGGGAVLLDGGAMPGLGGGVACRRQRPWCWRANWAMGSRCSRDTGS